MWLRLYREPEAILSTSLKGQQVETNVFDWWETPRTWRFWDRLIVVPMGWPEYLLNPKEKLTTATSSRPLPRWRTARWREPDENPKLAKVGDGFGAARRAEKCGDEDFGFHLWLDENLHGFWCDLNKFEGYYLYTWFCKLHSQAIAVKKPALQQASMKKSRWIDPIWSSSRVKSWSKAVFT